MGPTQPTRTCSKCSTSPAQKGDSWCKECRNAYQKEYREGAEWRAERRGIVRGIEAMRKASVQFFKGFGGRPFMGNEAAAAIQELPGPAVASEDAAKD